MTQPWKITYQVTVTREAIGRESAVTQAVQGERQLRTAVRAIVGGGTDHTVTIQHVEIAERRTGGDRRKAGPGD